jgi:hypothetical protein
MTGTRLRFNLPSPALTAALMLCLCGIAAANAEPKPEPENGRFALSPLPDGVMRLDTRTGDVSTCSNTGAGWACYAVPDERAALDAEIGRLQADNEKLKAELLASREPTVTGKIDEPLPKTDSLKPEPKVESDRKIEIPLPSDRDMDRVRSFLEQAWRRLVEVANRMQKDIAGKI